MKAKRTFSPEEKLAILKEAAEKGVKATLDRHGIYPVTYYEWRNKFQELGEDGLKRGVTAPQLKRIRELEKENKKLKEIIAEKELESKLKDELLKKKLALEKKKSSQHATSHKA
jgi:putative transposase